MPAAHAFVHGPQAKYTKLTASERVTYGAKAFGTECTSLNLATARCVLLLADT